MRDLLADLEVGEEVVDGLGENARPVDRVDCPEMVFLVEGSIREQRLHNVLKREKVKVGLVLSPMTRARSSTHLARVKCTLYGDIAHVGICDGRHLRFLHR